VAPAHLDRLSSVDAGFLHAEDTSPAAHMHIGGLAIFEGPAPTGPEFRGHVASRLHRLPRYRQRIVPAPYGTGRPLWVDDPNFSLSYHVRHTALPSPGRDSQLMTLASRIISQRLDRSKPLWEMWLVEGLEGDRWALVNKTHHAMVDGVGGIDLLTTLVDLSPETTDPPSSEPSDWHPRGAPGRLGLLARGAVEGAQSLVAASASAATLVTRPRAVANVAGSAARGLGDLLGTFVGGAPASPFNGAASPHRKLAVARTRLADYRTIKDGLGGTVNDVIIAVVAGGLRRWLADHGTDPDGLALRALVPVSVRSSDQRGQLGNQITVLVAGLPVQIDDPVERLAAAQHTMDSLKEGHQRVGANLLTRMEDFLPPTVLAQASRLTFSSRLYNLVVTNVPGPQFPVYVRGRRMRELVPVAFLGPRQQLAIAIVSYDGAVTFGLLSDLVGVPDLEGLARHVEDALQELVEAARTSPRGTRLDAPLAG
jgi:WS/DGAT/MGAT family acyltransferase